METIWWMVIVSVGERRYLLTFSETTWIKYQLWIILTQCVSLWTDPVLSLTCEADGIVVLEATDGNIRRTDSAQPVQCGSRYGGQLLLWTVVHQNYLEWIHKHIKDDKYTAKISSPSQTAWAGRWCRAVIIFVHHFVPWWPSRCKQVEFWIKGFWINSSVFVPAPQKYLKVVFCSRVPTCFINSTAVYLEFVDIKNPRTNHHIFKKFESAINIILYYNCISTVRHSQRVILHQQYYDVFMSLTGATLQMVGQFPEDSQDCSEATGRIQPSHWDPEKLSGRVIEADEQTERCDGGTEREEARDQFNLKKKKGTFRRTGFCHV